MRRKVIAGNWKMNKDRSGTKDLITELKSKISTPLKGVEVIICPPFTSLPLAAELLEGSPIQLGGQNMYPVDDGAFTGEISPAMLLSFGCRYVIVGHSERRQYFAETDAFINKKVLKALEAGLTPIVCVGETLEDREQNRTESVVTTQVKGALNSLAAAQVENMIIAYEPVWAIGTGRNATPQQAEDVHRMMRELVGLMFGGSTAEKVIIQYGGSVKADNATELLRQPDIDGALVGGACLKADSFYSIIHSAML